MTLGDQVIQVILSGLNTGCIYAIIGLAIAVVYNVTTIFDLSQGEYVMLAAMIVSSLRAAGVGLPLALLAAVVIPLAVGSLVWQLVFFGPSQREYPHMTLAMLTFGVAMLIEGIAFIVFGTDIRVTPYYIKLAPIRISGATVSPQTPLIYGAAAVMALGLYLLFHRTLVGKGLRACHEQVLAARLIGINPRRMRYLAFLLAVGLGSIGGIILVPFTAASYAMGMPLLLKGFLGALAGGISRYQGVMLGGLALGLLESLAAGFISSSYSSIIALTGVVIVLLFRPAGLLGPREMRA